MAVTFQIERPAGADRPDFYRADLIFYGLDHSGPSYEVRVFFNHPEAGPDTPLTADAGFAGRFAVFGHGGCFGDEGHCEVRAPVSPFDRRQPHPLEPLTRVLTVTDAVRGLDRQDTGTARQDTTVTVTAVPVVRPSPLASAEQAADVLVVDQVALVTYE